MKKIISLFICLCLAVQLFGCTRPEQPKATGNSSIQKYEKQFFDVFDTVTALTVYADSDERADEYFNTVHEELLRLHKLFDPYNNYDGVNNLKTINDHAGEEDFISVDTDLLLAIISGQEYYYKTDGTINIAMGATLELWHKYRDDAIENGNIAVPSTEELEATRPFNDIFAIEYSDDGHSVRLSKQGVSLNLGSIAKGIAADKAIALLKEKGCDSALVNLGGNVACFRGIAKDKPWKIGVQDAINPEGMIDVVNTDNGSLISSGNYQRFYEYNGKMYHHIIDPETLMPAEGKSGTTVICGEDVSCEIGDMLSTALFILPREKADALALEYNVQQVYYTDENGNVELLK